MGSMSGPEKQQPTESEKTLAAIADKEWKRFKGTYRPAENKFLDKVKKLGSPLERDRSAGRSAAEFSNRMGAASPDAGLSEVLSREQVRGGGMATQLQHSDATTKERSDRASESAIGLGRDVQGVGVSGITRQGQLEQSAQLAELQAQGIKDAAISDTAGTFVGMGVYGMGKPPSNPGKVAGMDVRNPRTASTYYDYPMA